jgi:hypothetical protein
MLKLLRLVCDTAALRQKNIIARALRLTRPRFTFIFVLV